MGSTTGNHDSIENIEQIFSKKSNFHRVNSTIFGPWNFIFLNTKYQNYGYGLLEDSELSMLEKELERNSSQFTAVIMHHHPIKVETPLIDNFILKRNKIFLSILNRYKVNLIICGHVHESYSLNYENIYMESGPASCFQFKKGAIELEIEKKIGYKIFYFSENGYNSETKWIK